MQVRTYLITMVIFVIGLVFMTEARAELEKIGIVGAANQKIYAKSLDGSKRDLTIGKDIYFNDTITTDAKGNAQVMFLDKSALSVGPNSSLVVDKFVYNPANGGGELSMQGTKGVFRFIGGALSKKQEVKFKTPVGTIGIRGGIAIVEIAESGATNATFLYGDKMSFENKQGQRQETTNSGFAINLAKPDMPPSAPAAVEPKELAMKVDNFISDKGENGGAKNVPTNAEIDKKVDINETSVLGVEQKGAVNSSDPNKPNNENQDSMVDNKDQNSKDQNGNDQNGQSQNQDGQKQDNNKQDGKEQSNNGQGGVSDQNSNAKNDSAQNGQGQDGQGKGQEQSQSQSNQSQNNGGRSDTANTAPDNKDSGMSGSGKSDGTKSGAVAQNPTDMSTKQGDVPANNTANSQDGSGSGRQQPMAQNGQSAQNTPAAQNGQALQNGPSTQSVMSDKSSGAGRTGILINSNTANATGALNGGNSGQVAAGDNGINRAASNTMTNVNGQIGSAPVTNTSQGAVAGNASNHAPVAYNSSSVGGSTLSRATTPTTAYTTGTYSSSGTGVAGTTAGASSTAAVRAPAVSYTTGTYSNSGTGVAGTTTGIDSAAAVRAPATSYTTGTYSSSGVGGATGTFPVNNSYNAPKTSYVAPTYTATGGSYVSSGYSGGSVAPISNSYSAPTTYVASNYAASNYTAPTYNSSVYMPGSYSAYNAPTYLPPVYSPSIGTYSYIAPVTSTYNAYISPNTNYISTTLYNSLTTAAATAAAYNTNTNTNYSTIDVAGLQNAQNNLYNSVTATATQKYGMANITGGSGSATSGLIQNKSFNELDGMRNNMNYLKTTTCSNCNFVNWDVWANITPPAGTVVTSTSQLTANMVPYVSGVKTPDLGAVGNISADYTGPTMINVNNGSVTSSSAGTFSARINITSGTSTATLTNFNFNVPQLGTTLSTTESSTITGSTFNNVSVNNGAGISGTVNGALFGSQAQNVGGNMNFGGAGVSGAGVYVGSKPQ